MFEARPVIPSTHAPPKNRTQAGAYRRLSRYGSHSRSSPSSQILPFSQTAGLPITAVLSDRPGRHIVTLPSVCEPVGFGLTTTSVRHEHMAKSEGARELCTLCVAIIITIH